MSAGVLPAGEWVVRHYTGADWPVIKGPGIELECAGATREQAEAIAARLTPSAAIRQMVETMDHDQLAKLGAHLAAQQPPRSNP